MATVAEIWRYPVKSMGGEPVAGAVIGPGGMVGDRGYALIDADTGMVASAKNPRRWPGLFHYAATYLGEPVPEAPLPAVQVTLPSGEQIGTDDPRVDAVLSGALQRKVTLSSAAPAQPRLEEYWPDLEELDHQDTVTDEAMPPRTFFDLAPLHLLTTSTLAHLAELYPDGRFELRRFRPNVLVDTGADGGFVENDWIGRTVTIGDEVQLRITGGCPRCVMTTLDQPDLPKDTGILRTAARHNDAVVGVYAQVVRTGAIRRGDSLRVEA